MPSTEETSAELHVSSHFWLRWYLTFIVRSQNQVQARQDSRIIETLDNTSFCEHKHKHRKKHTNGPWELKVLTWNVSSWSSTWRSWLWSNRWTLEQVQKKMPVCYVHQISQINCQTWEQGDIRDMHSLDVMMSLDPFCHTLQQRNAQPVLITQTCAECSNAIEREGFDSPSLHHPVMSRATHSCNVDRTHLCEESKCETIRRYWKYVSYRNFYHLLSMVVRRRHTCKEVSVDAHQPLIE